MTAETLQSRQDTAIASARPRLNGGTTREQHPLSAAFPAMSEADLHALADDIKKNGQSARGITLDGMVLDGWHRYLACEQAGVPFVSFDFDGEDPVAFVLSKNLHRRHLTPSQRAAAIVACTNWRPNGVTRGALVHGMHTKAEMANEAHVSPRTIVHAKQAHQAGLGDAVKDGKVSAKRAAAVAKLPPDERANALAQKPSKPKKTKVPTVPLAQHEALQKKYDTLSEKYDELVEELETCESIRSGAIAKDMNTLRQLLAQANRQRDEKMQIAVQMRKQIEALQRELKKLGWTGFKK